MGAYFNNKEDAFRAMIQYRNDEAVALARDAGKAVRAKGGSGLDIIAEISTSVTETQGRGSFLRLTPSN